LYGLPFGSLLNPDEQNVVPRAWRMTHGGGLDPHFFDWPTLVTYAVAPFQAWQSGPSYLAGRLVIVAFALGGVAAAWWLGSAAYGTVAGAVAALVIAFAGRLWDGLGPVLVIAAFSLIAALVSRSRRADLVLGAFVVAYYASLLPLHSHFPRYVLPLVPAFGALAGRFRAIAPVTLLLLVVPLAWSIRDDAELTRTDTRIVAASWIESHVPKGSTIAAESSTAVPRGFSVVPIPLPFPGEDARVDVGPARWVL